MMTRSQDYRDNRVARLPVHRVKDLLSEGCRSKAGDPRDQTNPHQHDRKQRKWIRTTPQTPGMRLLRRNLPLRREKLHRANLHKANQLQAKDHQVESQPNKGKVPGKVHKTINKANLKGLIRNVSKLRLT